MIPALLGLVLGLGSGALSVSGLWLVTRMAAGLASGLRVSEPVERISGWDRERADGEEGPFSEGGSSGPGGSRVWRPSPGTERSSGLPRATLLLFFTFLLKAPLFLLVVLGARRLGGDSLPWCVAGVVSVYCLAVFWAAARTRTG